MLKEKCNPIRQKKYYPILAVVGYVLPFVLQFVVLELSCQDPGDIAAMSPAHMAVAVISLMFFSQVLLLITGSVRVSLSVSAVSTSVLAIVNYYVYGLHGTPFTFALIRNAGTALNVLSAYHLEIGKRVLLMAAAAGIQILWACLIFGRGCWNRKKSLLPTAVLLGAMAWFYMGSTAVIPGDVVGWSWPEAISRYGYTDSLCQVTIQSVHSTIKPRGYDEKKLEKLAGEQAGTPGRDRNPDVILILNETFYDLRQITDVEPDSEFLPVLGSLENSVRGYAVVPGIGGGTNKSEYELLTSNSLQVAPNITPFNFFDMEDANSVVSFLKSQGYETAAIHNAPSLNYNRSRCYPQMGFDTARFEKDFEISRYYGTHRFPTDESVYENMEKWYEQMGDSPRFFYILTIQNHGGYTFLEEPDVTVHTGRDYGEHTSEVNQFLSLISQSDQAFGTLVDYYSRSDRDVIICMVGDHGPSFIRDVADETLTEDQRELRLRSTPFVIWSNHIDLTGAKVPERMSMPFLTPTVMELAGLPLSGYYEFLLELRDQVPVVSAYGTYMTAGGTFGKYSDLVEDPWGVEDYLGFSYANINGKDFMHDFTRP